MSPLRRDVVGIMVAGVLLFSLGVAVLMTFSSAPPAMSAGPETPPSSSAPVEPLPDESDAQEEFLGQGPASETPARGQVAVAEKKTVVAPVVKKTVEPKTSAGPEKPSVLPRPPSEDPVVEEPQGPTQAEQEAIRIKAIQDQRRAECMTKTNPRFYPEGDGGRGVCMSELHPDPQPVPEA